MNTADRDDWDSHWDAIADDAYRNPANLYRQRRIIELLGHLDGAKRLLDIGCGQGELLEVLRRAFPDAQLMGIDYAQAGVDRARRRVPSAMVERRDLLEQISLPDSQRGWASHAVCEEVLEHVDDPTLLLKNAAPYLAPGCRLVVTVPSGPRSTFDRYIGHRRHFTPASLRKVLEGAGFEVARIDRAGFPFFNLYKLVVIAQGRRLVADAESGSDSGQASPSVAERAALGFFQKAFHGNLNAAPWGWQLTAVAWVPA